MNKVSLYYHTVKNMKPGQVLNRLRIRLGRGCPLGAAPSDNITDVRIVESPAALDFDPVFLARFPVEELMADKITILHSSKKTDWKTMWEFDDKSPLWNFNLHYFEYLFPLLKEWRDTGDRQYLDKTVEMITGWIDGSPKGTGPAWAPYTTALRITAWISCFGHVYDAIEEDFRQKFLFSLHSQYVHLTGHLEKDILGNHYFEDLKSLVLAAVFFRDDAVLSKALTQLKAECREQILPDGVHFELSPMYHKIILEGLLRVAAALKGVGRQDEEIEAYLQPMLDAAYSFEDGLERIPLFNDAGNNVAKSLDSLAAAADQRFGLKPKHRSSLESGGFYFFQRTVGRKAWKLIVDAGQPGPGYIPGHAHCDAMSFELFCDGKPVVVNCGTYAYQCRERGFFRSTAAHNTVMVDGVEQSQCWGVFRLARRSSTRVLDITNCAITMEMTDQRGNAVCRSIVLGDNGLYVRDKSKNKALRSYVHILDDTAVKVTAGMCRKYEAPYAPDYGRKTAVTTYELHGGRELEYRIAAEEALPRLSDRREDFAGAV